MKKEMKIPKRLGNALIKSIVPLLIKKMFDDGIISETDLHNKDIVNDKVRKYINENKIDYKFTVDHRSEILDRAEKEAAKGGYQFAITFYATYFEHTLNSIIALKCESKKYEIDIQEQLIRRLSLEDKCTWILRLLELKPINKNHINVIKQISDKRNSFVHYKWKPEPDEVGDLDKEKRIEKDTITSIKKTIRYLKRYESIVQFQGKKHKMHKAVSRAK
jgi:hypothetical protein